MLLPPLNEVFTYYTSRALGIQHNELLFLAKSAWRGRICGVVSQPIKTVPGLSSPFSKIRYGLISDPDPKEARPLSAPVGDECGWQHVFAAAGMYGSFNPWGGWNEVISIPVRCNSSSNWPARLSLLTTAGECAKNEPQCRCLIPNRNARIPRDFETLRL